MASREDLEKAHDKLAKTLSAAMDKEDCPVGILNVARQFLKDNGIEARAATNSPLGDLAAKLPVFPAEDDADAPLLPN